MLIPNSFRHFLGVVPLLQKRLYKNCLCCMTSPTVHCFPFQQNKHQLIHTSCTFRSFMIRSFGTCVKLFVWPRTRLRYIPKPRNIFCKMVQKVELKQKYFWCADRPIHGDILLCNVTTVSKQLFKFFWPPSAKFMWIYFVHHIEIHVAYTRHIRTILKLCCTVDICHFNRKYHLHCTVVLLVENSTNAIV